MKDTFAWRLFDFAMIMGLIALATAIVPDKPAPQACEACRKELPNVRYSVADLERQVSELASAVGSCR